MFTALGPEAHQAAKADAWSALPGRIWGATESVPGDWEARQRKVEEEVVELDYVEIVLDILNGAITCTLWRWGIGTAYKNAHVLLLPTISLLSWLCNFLSVFFSLSTHIPVGFRYTKNELEA